MNKIIKFCAGVLSCTALFASCSGEKPVKASALARFELTDVNLAAAVFPSPFSITWNGESTGLSLIPHVFEDGITFTQAPAGTIDDINLSIPQRLNITRPSGAFTTTFEKYFITGTSNPAKPLYFDDEEIERAGTKGTFGVLAELEIGENSFTFSQGEESRTVVITREKQIPADSIPIDEITQASMMPTSFICVKAGGELELSCVAPSEASVTASFGGAAALLKQVAETQEPGLPALYKGKIKVDGKYEGDITQNAGKVSYKLEYDGNKSEYASTGDVYVSGANSDMAVRVKTYMGFLYPNLSDLSIFRENLKNGACDYLKSQTNTYAELKSGGFVPKERLEVIEGKVHIDSKLKNVKTAIKTNSEAYVFAGADKSVYVTKLSERKFSITLFNTEGAPEIDISKSALFSNIEVEAGKKSVTYIFTQKNDMLWGYNVNYEGKNTILTFNYKPVLAPDPRPFENLTIILDPGHGGEDKGALGLAADTGPAETDVNLAHAYAARDLLREMGANVLLTRSGNVYFPLDDRLKSPEDVDADFFISIHHNSIVESVDANKVSGVEVYYHTGLSKKFAQSMFDSITDKLDWKKRFVNQSYYRVTLSPYSPAILVELGFMSNPAEYERATDRSQIDKVAQAIADGITSTLS